MGNTGYEKWQFGNNGQRSTCKGTPNIALYIAPRCVDLMLHRLDESFIRLDVMIAMLMYVSKAILIRFVT